MMTMCDDGEPHRNIQACVVTMCDDCDSGIATCVVTWIVAVTWNVVWGKDCDSHCDDDNCAHKRDCDDGNCAHERD